MNDFFIVLFHTFISKLKTKSYFLTTFLTVVLMLGLTNIPNIMDAFNKDGVDTIAVIDPTGQLYEPLKEQMKAINKDLELDSFNGKAADAIQDVEQGKYEGILELTLNDQSLPTASYKAMSIADSSIPMDLQTAMQQIKTMMAASQIEIASDQLEKLYEPVEFSQAALAKGAKTEEELNQARGLVYVLLFIIYFAVLMYGNMIAMEVATEKSSRVMEILISSVSPIKQMFAKILGVGLLSLIQLAVLLLTGYFSIKYNLESLQEGFFEFFGFGNIPASTIAYAVIFFLLGYFLYSTMAAFLGSLVSRIEDVQQMITPMTLLIIAGFMMAMFGLGKPDAPFITYMSFIPFFSPMLMFLRVGMLNIPFWEVALSIGILVATIIILAIFGARVYRGGVLMYGKSNSFKDIRKALQLTKSE